MLDLLKIILLNIKNTKFKCHLVDITTNIELI